MYCVVCGDPLEDSIAFGTDRIFCYNCIEKAGNEDIHTYTVADVIREILDEYDDTDEVYDKLGALGKNRWDTLIDVIATDIADRLDGFDVYHLIGRAYDELKRLDS